MKHNINFVMDALVAVDNDPQKCMFFWSHNDKKQELISNLIYHSVTGQDHLQGFEAEQRMKEIVSWLDNHFHNNEWPLHEVHFHTDFQSYINCPFTCINEISSNFERMLKDNFHA